MEVVRTGDTCVAMTDAGETGDARILTRPDGRRFLLWHAADAATRRAMIDAMLDDDPLQVEVDEADTELVSELLKREFRAVRREIHFVVPVPATTPSVEGVTVISAAAADIDLLRALDELVREDIPGSDGWRWTPKAFRTETFGRDFDPDTYVVAVDPAGRYLGLLRVWLTPDRARLGCLAVLPEVRRSRVTAALVHTIANALRDKGIDAVDCEITDTNRPALSLLAGRGGTEVGRSLELRRGPVSRTG